MRKIFSSHNGATTLSLIAFGIFFARVVLDFRYVFNDAEVFPQEVGSMAGTILLYTVIFTGWLWVHIIAERGSKRAWNWIAILSGLAFLQAISTTLLFCPTPCETAWPLAEIINWATLISTLPACIASIIQFRK